jgi:hypothetical protein
MYKLVCTFFPAVLFYAGVYAADPAHVDTIRTAQKAKQALQFCKQKGYNSSYCILIDMSLHSGAKRFILWDLKKHRIRLSGLVSNGCGSNAWSGTWGRDKPTFSNADGSHCTALGKYRIDSRAYSQWGVHVKYFLTGLESTNNNAYKREIVFHSWEKVPEEAIYPNGTPEGWGCPAISNQVMSKVDALLRQQKKHTLLWIYN